MYTTNTFILENCYNVMLLPCLPYYRNFFGILQTIFKRFLFVDLTPWSHICPKIKIRLLYIEAPFYLIVHYIVKWSQKLAKTIPQYVRWNRILRKHSSRLHSFLCRFLNPNWSFSPLEADSYGLDSVNGRYKINNKTF